MRNLVTDFYRWSCSSLHPPFLRLESLEDLLVWQKGLRRSGCLCKSVCKCYFALVIDKGHRRASYIGVSFIQLPLHFRAITKALPPVKPVSHWPFWHLPITKYIADNSSEVIHETGSELVSIIWSFYKWVLYEKVERPTIMTIKKNGGEALSGGSTQLEVERCFEFRFLKAMLHIDHVWSLFCSGSRSQESHRTTGARWGLSLSHCFRMPFFINVFFFF